MRDRRLRLVGVVSIFILSACSSSPTGLTPDAGDPAEALSLTGNYQLVAVGGLALPSGYEERQGNRVLRRFKYLQGSLMIRENGTWSILQRRSIVTCWECRNSTGWADAEADQSVLTWEFLEGHSTMGADGSVVLHPGLGGDLPGTLVDGRLEFRDTALNLTFRWQRA